VTETGRTLLSTSNFKSIEIVVELHTCTMLLINYNYIYIFNDSSRADFFQQKEDLHVEIRTSARKQNPRKWRQENAKMLKFKYTHTERFGREMEGMGERGRGVGSKSTNNKGCKF